MNFQNLQKKLTDTLRNMIDAVRYDPLIILKPLSSPFVQIGGLLLVLLIVLTVTRGRETIFLRDRARAVPELGEDVYEFTDVAALSRHVGFPVREIKTLPFDVKKTIYRSYHEIIAEITYEGDEKTLVYRKSVGAENISGDNKMYPVLREMMIHSNSVSMKGDGEAIILAIWTNISNSYSLRVEEGMTNQEFTAIIQQIDY